MVEPSSGSNRVPIILACTVIAGSLLTFAPGWIAKLRATQGAVATFTRLLEAGNTQDLAGAQRLCSLRFLEGHPLKPAEEGGIVGLPRNIHKNFQAWCDGRVVFLCPTNRVGPVYRLVNEVGQWKFDGLAGLLAGDGRITEATD